LNLGRHEKALCLKIGNSEVSTKESLPRNYPRQE
jgi:hypothetical protein